jgi:capsular exopolysaccharide synthesis family protein
VELRDYLGVLRRRKWILAGVFAAAVAVALAGTHFAGRHYTAASTVHVATGISVLDRSVRADDVVYLDRLENTYAKLATGQDLVAKVQRQVKLPELPEVSVKAVPNTELMDIVVTTTSPRLAKRAADRLAALLIARVRELNAEQSRRSDASFNQRMAALAAAIKARQTKVARLSRSSNPSVAVSLALQELKTSIALKTSSMTAQQEAFEAYRAAHDERANSLSIAERALVPTSPSSPNARLNVALAVVLGLVGGVALVFLVENLSTRMSSKGDITNVVDLSVLGVIPKVKNARRDAILDNSLGEEAFRRLTAALIALQGRNRFTTLLIASAQPGEGKSLTTVNLARSIAERDHRVVVVDADVRLPSLHRMLGVPNERGLADVVSRRVQLNDAIQPTTLSPRLFVLPSGRLAPGLEQKNPGALLALPQAAAVLHELSNRFDYVIVDSPAILAVADALALVPIVDAALLVVSENQVSREELITAYDQLVSIHAPLLGIVVNRAAQLQTYTRHYQRYMEQASGAWR